MKDLLIIGARGWGREVYNMLPDCLGYGTDYYIKGFLDDNENALVGKLGYPKIISSVENYEIKSNDVFVCALGSSSWKKYYVEKVLSKGGEFINLINKTASVQKNAQIGKGCIVGYSVKISCDIIIGDFVTIQSYSIVGHDVQIGDFCHLGCRSFMGGYSTLGTLSTVQTNSIVLPHIKVGDNCMVGAGAVVIKKVKQGETVFGNPAKIVAF